LLQLADLGQPDQLGELVEVRQVGECGGGGAVPLNGVQQRLHPGSGSQQCADRAQRRKTFEQVQELTTRIRQRSRG